MKQKLKLHFNALVAGALLITFCLAAVICFAMVNVSGDLNYLHTSLAATAKYITPIPSPNF